MTTPDARWIQRLEKFHCASAILRRGIGLSQTRALSELKQQPGLEQVLLCDPQLSKGESAAVGCASGRLDPWDPTASCPL